MYKNSELEVLQAPIKMLRLYQLWPQPGESFHETGPIFRATLVLIYCSMTMFGCIMHVHFMIQHPETIIIVDLIESIITTLVNITVYYTIYTLLVHKDEVQEFMYDLNDYHEFGKPPTIEGINKLCNRFCYFCYSYGIGGAATYSLVGLLDRQKCKEIDVDNTRICGFLVPLRFPINVDPPVTYAILWFLECVSLSMLLTSGLIIMAFIFASTEIFITKIKHMRDEILKLGENPETAKQKIKYCVDYHVKIIKMCKNLNYCWGRLMLFHQMLVSMIMSLIGIQFLLESDPKCLIHAGGWFISLAIPCYAGQRLLDESTDIPWAMYSTHWYNLDTATQKSIIYMIMCGNNYLNLNRDGYGPMNLSIVGQVMHNIYSFLTLLSESMKEKN